MRHVLQMGMLIALSGLLLSSVVWAIRPPDAEVRFMLMPGDDLRRQWLRVYPDGTRPRTVIDDKRSVRFSYYDEVGYWYQEVGETGQNAVLYHIDVNGRRLQAVMLPGTANLLAFVVRPEAIFYTVGVHTHPRADDFRYPYQTHLYELSRQDGTLRDYGVFDGGNVSIVGALPDALLVLSTAGIFREFVPDDRQYGLWKVPRQEDAAPQLLLGMDDNANARVVWPLQDDWLLLHEGVKFAEPGRVHQLWRINLQTLAVENINGLPPAPDVVYLDAHTSYAIQDNVLYAIDMAAQTQRQIVTLPENQNPSFGYYIDPSAAPPSLQMVVDTPQPALLRFDLASGQRDTVFAAVEGIIRWINLPQGDIIATEYRGAHRVYVRDADGDYRLRFAFVANSLTVVRHPTDSNRYLLRLDGSQRYGDLPYVWDVSRDTLQAINAPFANIFTILPSPPVDARFRPVLLLVGFGTLFMAAALGSLWR